jgi:hypothetical protein
MCGIVGLIAKRRFGFYMAQEEIFRDLLFVDTLRGPDSTGVFGITKAGNVSTLKAAVSGPQFVELEDFKNFQRSMSRNYMAVIGHNRKATKGNVTGKNAHPFKVGDITLVHNGTVWGDNDFKEGVEVDSHQIAHNISEKGEFVAVPEINGAYALVFYNKKDKTLNLCRNDMRPLSLLETDGFWVISSEAALAHAILIRHNVKLQRVHGIPLKTMVVFDMDKEPETFYTVGYDYTPVRKEVPKESPKEEPKSSTAPEQKFLPAPASNGGIFDDGERGNYEVVSKHGTWAKNEMVLIRPFDYKPVHPIDNNSHNFVFFEIMAENNTPMPQVIGRLYVHKDETDKYIDKAKSEYFVGKISLIKVPKIRTGDQRLVLILAADFQETPRAVECGVSKNGLLVEREIFNGATHTGCRTCQSPLMFSSLDKYSMIRDAQGKMRFYCSQHGLTSIDGEKAA